MSLKCINCGNPAKYTGTHPEAGPCAVCEDCVERQGFDHLKPITRQCECGSSGTYAPPVTPGSLYMDVRCIGCDAIVRRFFYNADPDRTADQGVDQSSEDLA